MNMITILSKSISHFLLERDIIPKEEAEIYQYGFETIISTVLGFLIIASLGILFHMFWLALLYYAVFVFLRQLTGGYHADTYFRCNFTFAILSGTLFGVTRLLNECESYSLLMHGLLLSFSVLVIAVYAPVENPYKPLDEKQMKQNRKYSLIMSGIIGVLSVLIYPISSMLTIMLGLTLFLIAMLILIVKIQERGKSHEQASDTGDEEGSCSS